MMMILLLIRINLWNFIYWRLKMKIKIYQILNIIIAKYLLSFYYYKYITSNKRYQISKKSKRLKNIHVTSQIQFENFNGLEINLCKDEIITMEKYFESIDKGI